jgi:hypothetical protein
MLIIALAIWLFLLMFVVGLCRVAASGDDIEMPLQPPLPEGSTVGVRTAAGGLVVWEEEPQALRQEHAPLLRHPGRLAAGSRRSHA